ncbi:MAG TPA: GNAT family N-acetyltransferase [Acidimicrobiia bacterium]|nr:GNAT family N-acetyltransferase [Acidimicrobiia bacterium]
MADVTVRSARPDEYERVAQVTIDAYRALEVDHLFDGYDDEIRDVAGRAERAEVLVAVDADGAVLGAVTFVSDPESAWLEWAEPGEVQFRLLAVDPNVQGRGVGELLARACVERARALGAPIVIHTTQWMHGAHRLYPRLGFRRAPERDVHELYPGWVFEAYVLDPAPPEHA